MTISICKLKSSFCVLQSNTGAGFFWPFSLLVSYHKCNELLSLINGQRYQNRIGSVEQLTMFKSIFYQGDQYQRHYSYFLCIAGNKKLDLQFIIKTELIYFNDIIDMFNLVF